MSLAVRPSGHRPSRSLSYGEEKYLNEQINYLEDQKSRKEVQQGVNYDPRDMHLVNKKLAELKTVRGQHATVRLEGKERVQAELELKQIEDAIAKKWGGKLPTYAEYWMNQKQGGIHYLNLVNKIYKLNKDLEYAALISRWKSIRRGLEPEDKDISNTLHLFKH